MTSSLKNVEIEWEALDKGNMVLRCPCCNRAWMDNEDYELKPCPHLALVWFEQGDPHFFGKADRRGFRRAYSRAYEEAEGEPLMPRRWTFSYDAFRALRYSGFSTLAVLVESGIACGPVSFVTFFGLVEDTA